MDATNTKIGASFKKMKELIDQNAAKAQASIKKAWEEKATKKADLSMLSSDEDAEVGEKLTKFDRKLTQHIKKDFSEIK